MFDTPESRLERLLAHLVAHVLRLAPVVLILALLLTVVCAVYVKNNLGINTDTEDLLSETLPWRADYLAYKQRFPQFADTIAVVVDADTADAAEDAAATMREALAADRDLFADAFALAETEFLRRNQLLFLELEELEDLADRLAQAQPFLARLAAAPDLVGVFDTLTAALDEAAAGSRFPIASTLREVDAALADFSRGGSRRLSWQRLISGADDLPTTRVVLVQPHLDYSRLLPGEPAVLAIREQARALGYNVPGAPTVRLTGSAALGYEELDSVTRGASRAGVLALIMVTICLILGLRSPALIAATLIALVMGLIMTAAFATWAIGELNLISVAFAVLYVGLAVDFAIHYVLRVRELRMKHEKAFALTHACIHVGGSLSLCALTTAVGFYAFIPTSYQGVAELGLIGGTSMFIGLAMSLTVLPAVLSLLPIREPAAKRSSGLSDWLIRLPVTHARYVLSGTLLLAIAALALLPRAQFDHNPIHLQDPQAESVQTFRDLLNNASRSPYSITVLADNHAAARRDSAAAAALPEVDSVTFVDDFIPADQDDKLVVLEDLALTLGPDLEIVDKPRPGAAAERAALAAFRAAVTRFAATGSDTSAGRVAASLKGNLAGTEARLDADPLALDVLHDVMLGNLPGRLTRLADALAPFPVTLASLPAEIKDRWISADGRYRIDITPRENLDDNAALEAFVDGVQAAVTAPATGAPVINLEASNAVVNAFLQAFVSALAAITLLLWLLLRQLREVLLALAPLLLAGLFTCAITVATGTPFNFANIIALPLLLGIGVDNALHMLHRYRTDLPPHGLILSTSTARAVWFSALTTSCGFGNLAVSPHLGTASMGVLLTIGVIVTLLCTLFVLPSMLVVMPLKQDTGESSLDS